MVSDALDFCETSSSVKRNQELSQDCDPHYRVLCSPTRAMYMRMRCSFPAVQAMKESPCLHVCRDPTTGFLHAAYMQHYITSCCTAQTHAHLVRHLLELEFVVRVIKKAINVFEDNSAMCVLAIAGR